MISRHRLLTALAVFAVALMMRLPVLGADLFHTDSVFQARAVESWVLDGEFAYMHRPGYPGQVVLAAPVFWLHHALTGATSAAFAVTLQSALAGAVAAGLMVLFARNFPIGTAGGLGAGLIVAALPTLLSTTTFAMSHGTQVALLLGAGTVAAGATRRALLATGVLMGLAVATRTESVFFVPAILAIHWRATPPLGFDRERGLHLNVSAPQLLRDVALVIGPMIAVTLALYAKQLGEIGMAAFSQASADTGWLGPISTALPLGLAGVVRSLTIGGALLAVIGVFAQWRQDRAGAVIVLLWFVLPFVFLANTKIVVPRHLISAVIVLAIPIAVALQALLQRNRWVFGATLVGLLTWMSVPLIPTLVERSRRCLPADYARAVGALVPPGSVVVAMDLRPHLEYFGAVETLGHAVLDGSRADDAGVASSVAAIRAALAAGTPVFVASDAFAYDAPHPTHGVVRVEIGGGEDGAAGEEAIGYLGITLIETFELRHVLTTEYEDWHGASLGARAGASQRAHLYRIVP